VIEPLPIPTALSPWVRYLPKVGANGYRVGDQETLAAALHRLTTEQFTIAINTLTQPGEDVTGAALTALDALARIAAVLGLVRSVIGDEAYRTEVTILDETATRLRALLAGHGEVAAIDQLRARYSAVLRPETFTQLRTALVQRHQVWRLHALSGQETVDATIHALRRARARFAAWPIEGDSARMYGRDPIPDQFESISPGLRSTYKRSRQLWRASGQSRDRETFAEWRKESIRLGNHLALLAVTWPAVVEAMAAACTHLGAVLAEADQILALSDAVAADAGLCPDPIERSLLDTLVTGTTSELSEIAAALGGRIFVEPSKVFMSRFSGYWEAKNLLR